MKEIPPIPPGAKVRLERTRNGDDCWGDPVWKIALPQWQLSQDDPSMGDRINSIRTAAVARREEMLSFQKARGVAKDKDGAKFFKGEAADAMKEYRAACLLLPMFLCAPPGDCPVVPEWEWPVELAPWMDRVIGLAEGH